MNTRDFCIWFKGFLDVTRASQLETIQLDIVKKQLEETLKEPELTAGVPPIMFGGFSPGS